MSNRDSNPFTNISNPNPGHVPSPSVVQTNDFIFTVEPIGWYLYFPTVRWTNQDFRSRLIKAFVECVFKPLWKAERIPYLVDLERSGVYHLSYPEVEKMTHTSLDDFPLILRNRPQAVINALGAALCEVLYGPQGIAETMLKSKTFLPFTPEPTKILIRLYRHNIVTPLNKLKSNCIGKYVTVQATIIRVSIIRPLVTFCEFVCMFCGCRIERKFLNGLYSPPNSCETGGCKSKRFVPDRSSAVTVDWQQLKIQELLGSASTDPGRVPRSFTVEITRDLVDTCVPGDIVFISGLIKPIESGYGGSGRQFGSKHNPDAGKGLFQLYIEANSLWLGKVPLNFPEFRPIVSSSSSKKAVRVSSHLTNPAPHPKVIHNIPKTIIAGPDISSQTSTSLSSKDLKFINEMKQKKDIFKLLVHSVCPHIYGHTDVKAGMVLSLFGGVPKYENDPNKIRIRSDIHILIVGDPGLGKSQMLRSVSQLAPRGVYICGNTTSTSGLTVTLIKTPQTGDYSLEAGALVLGDRGVCCIDEFDKMTREHNALLECMEQQCISLAKAGVVCTLPARTAIIAAANPYGGHYDRSLSISENLKMNPALLSRFDLIFILLDEPDVVRDQKLVDHVMKIHSSSSSLKPFNLNTSLNIDPTSVSNSSAKHFGFHQTSSNQEFNQSDTTRDTTVDLTDETPSERTNGFDISLKERLTVSNGTQVDPLPPELFRKYVDYARTHVSPRLSVEACKVLQDLYLTLRENYQTIDATPITTRQLEAMIRCAEARARLELRDTVTERDAKDVVELMNESLLNIFMDENGDIDFSRGANGTGLSKRKAVLDFVQRLHTESIRLRTDTFTKAQLYDVAAKMFDRKILDNFGPFLDTLNTHSYLLLAGNRQYRLPNSAYSRQRSQGSKYSNTTHSSNGSHASDNSKATVATETTFANSFSSHGTKSTNTFSGSSNPVW